MPTKCPKCDFDNPDATRFCGNCAAPLKSSKDIPFTKTLETPIKGLAKGSTIAGRYEILEQLGRGGMGEVYRVRDTANPTATVRQEKLSADTGFSVRTISKWTRELHDSGWATVKQIGLNQPNSITLHGKKVKHQPTKKDH